MDPKVDALKNRIRPILEEFIREHHPDFELGAFVLNVFATHDNGDILQHTFGDGNDSKISALDAWKFVMQTMQHNLAQWEQPMRPEGTPQAQA